MCLACTIIVCYRTEFFRTACKLNPAVPYRCRFSNRNRLSLKEVSMKFAGVKLICRVLIASLLMLQFSLSNAGMVGAEQMLPAVTVQADRAVVTGALSRAEVATQLQAMGVEPALAQDRV